MNVAIVMVVLCNSNNKCWTNNFYVASACVDYVLVLCTHHHFRPFEYFKRKHVGQPKQHLKYKQETVSKRSRQTAKDTSRPSITNSTSHMENNFDYLTIL